MNLQKTSNDTEMYSHLYPQAETYIKKHLGFFSDKPFAGLVSTRFLIACVLNDVEKGYFTLEQAEQEFIHETLDTAKDFFLSRNFS